MSDDNILRLVPRSNSGTPLGQGDAFTRGRIPGPFDAFASKPEGEGWQRLGDVLKRTVARMRPADGER